MSSSSTVASAGGLPDDVVNLLRKGSACTQEELTGLEEKLISLKVDMHSSGVVAMFWSKTFVWC